MSTMADDVKVKRLIRKHGVDGYGLYNYVIELIVRRLDTESPMPDLEESAEDIAGDLGMDTLKVERIMSYCVELDLFSMDEVNGRIVAHKVYKFLDSANTRSQDIKRMIAAYNTASGTVRDSQRLSPPEQNRTEQNTTYEREHAPEVSEKSTQTSLTASGTKHEQTGRPMNSTRYASLLESYNRATLDDYFERVANYEAQSGKAYKDHAATVANWLKRDKVSKHVRLVPNCPSCGTARAGDMLYCHKCGKDF